MRWKRDGCEFKTRNCYLAPKFQLIGKCEFNHLDIILTSFVFLALFLIAILSVQQYFFLLQAEWVYSTLIDAGWLGIASLPTWIQYHCPDSEVSSTFMIPVLFQLGNSPFCMSFQLSDCYKGSRNFVQATCFFFSFFILFVVVIVVELVPFKLMRIYIPGG